MKRLFLASVAGLALASSANANTTQYFAEDLTPTQVLLGGMPNSVAARTAFIGGLVGVGTENFESYTVGTVIPPPLAISFVGAGTATLAANIANSVAISNAPGTNGRWGTSDALGDARFVETFAGGDFHILFDNPGGVAAFGFYATDLGDFGNRLALRFTRNDNTTYDIVVNHSIDNTQSGATSGRAIFFGVIADAADVFKRIDFLNNPGGIDIFGFDDMTVGGLEQVIPLPTAAWMGMVGLIGVGLIRRRMAR